MQNQWESWKGNMINDYWMNEWALRDIIKMLKMLIYNYCNSYCIIEYMKLIFNDFSGRTSLRWDKGFSYNMYRIFPWGNSVFDARLFMDIIGSALNHAWTMYVDKNIDTRQLQLVPKIRRNYLIICNFDSNIAENENTSTGFVCLLRMLC